MNSRKSKSIVEELILISKQEDLEKYCESLYLVGSHSRGDCHQSSDVDLLVVIRSIDFVSKVLEILNIFKRYVSQFEQELDLRIYTRAGFREAYSGVNHFSLWSSIDSGLLILGDSIQTSLNYSLVKSGLLHWIDRVDESIVSLEQYSQFEGACFVLYSALVWFFFLEKHLCPDCRTSLSKEQLLEFFLGNMKCIISSNYDKIVQKIRKKSVFPFEGKIRTKVNGNWSKSEYSKLLGVAEKIAEYGNEVHRKITKAHFD